LEIQRQRHSIRIRRRPDDEHRKGEKEGGVQDHALDAAGAIDPLDERVDRQDPTSPAGIGIVLRARVASHISLAFF
jgi:hypothetical protein